MHNFNLTIFSIINGWAGHYRTLDTIILFISSDLTYVVIGAVVFYMVCWLPFRKNFSFQLLRKAFESVVAVGVTWIVVEVLKAVVAAPRPFTVLTNIHSLSPSESGYSFPSGHAAVTVALATVIYVTYNKRLGVLLYCFAIVVSISRIYIGVHYPIDVFVGALLGFAIPALFHILFNPQKKTKDR